MEVAFSLDPRLELAAEDELRLVALGAGLGYAAAWTPATPGPEAFDRCVAWHRASGLPTGISVVPASGQPPEVYAERARAAHAATAGTFTLGVGSGGLHPAVPAMREYLPALQAELEDGPPVYLAAMGPRMLALAGERAAGVCLNWCSAASVAWSRDRVQAAAATAGRPAPPLVEYVRVCVDSDRAAARATLARAMLAYALGIPAYRAHFVDMGFAEHLEFLERRRAEGASDGELAEAAPEDLLSGAGAYGDPEEAAAGFLRLGQGLDVAVVRVLVSRPGDAGLAEMALRACRPGGS